MHHVIVAAATGALLAGPAGSVEQLRAVDPATEQLLSFDGPAPTGLVTWDRSARAFVVVALAAPAPATTPASLSPTDLRQRFTTTERMALEAAADGYTLAGGAIDRTTAQGAQLVYGARTLAEDARQARDYNPNDPSFVASITAVVGMLVALGVVPADAEAQAARVAALTAPHGTYPREQAAS
jgi:hypothetical protein